MKIRPATVADAPAISALVRALTQEFIAPELTEEAAKRLLESMNAVSIRAYIRAGYRYHVAEAEGEIVGLIGVKESRHLYHLFVSRSFQRRGWARQLWETAQAASLADGNPGRFTVHSSLGAVGFYEKIGFVKESEAVHRAGIVYVPMKREGADPPSK